MQQVSFNIGEVFEQYDFEGEFTGSYQCAEAISTIRLSLSFEVNAGWTNRYLSRQINTNVFKNPDELMENIVGVTAYLKRLSKTTTATDRETLTVIFTKSGKPYFRDSEGNIGVAIIT